VSTAVWGTIRAGLCTGAKVWGKGRNRSGKAKERKKKNENPIHGGVTAQHDLTKA